MHPLSRSIAAAAAALALAVPGASPVAAQDAPAIPYRQVISANPFGLLLEIFNAEYERVIGESSTAGVGGSYFTSDDVDYLNADVFYRFYPSARPLDGWAFGGKLGVTRVQEDETYLGLGFDVNRSWLLGRRQNFSVGIGIGLKRLFGTGSDYGELEYIPTIRLVNIGFAF
jgi:hypothetical protein